MRTPTAYRRENERHQPPYLHPDYRSTVERSPRQPLVRVPHSLSEVTGPLYGRELVEARDTDLTRPHEGGEALGQRIIVHGAVTDEDGQPVPNALIEVWQCNAAGRYHHEVDQHDAPLDPNFTGAGRVATDDVGRYRFVTIAPGAYPWGNHANAWRPRHIHFSLFGPSHATRLVTQMYFPGDPLLSLDPIYLSIPDEAARERLLCALDMDATVPEWALAYRFDIVLRGREATPATE